MNKVRIGVLGGHRGSTMIDYCKKADNAEVVAICDKLPETLEAHRQRSERSFCFAGRYSHGDP